MHSYERLLVYLCFVNAGLHYKPRLLGDSVICIFILQLLILCLFQVTDTYLLSYLVLILFV